MPSSEAKIMVLSPRNGNWLMSFLHVMDRVLTVMKDIWEQISALFNCLKVIIEVISKLVND